MDSKDIQSIDGMNKDASWAPEEEPEQEAEEDQESATPIFDKSRSAKNRMLTSTLVLALLVIGAVTTFYLSRRSGDIRQRASSTPCSIENEKTACKQTEQCLISNKDLNIGTCVEKSTLSAGMQNDSTITPMNSMVTSSPSPTILNMNAELTCKLSINGNVLSDSSKIVRVKNGSTVKIMATSPAGITGVAITPIDSEQWIRPTNVLLRQNTVEWNWTAIKPEGTLGDQVYVVCNNTIDNNRCTGNPWCENGKCFPILDCGPTDKIILQLI